MTTKTPPAPPSRSKQLNKQNDRHLSTYVISLEQDVDRRTELFDHLLHTDLVTCSNTGHSGSTASSGSIASSGSTASSGSITRGKVTSKLTGSITRGKLTSKLTSKLKPKCVSDIRHFRAVDGSAAAEWKRARKLVWPVALKKMKVIQSRGYSDSFGELVSPGAIACALSHFGVWLDILLRRDDISDDEPVLVMEDDAKLKTRKPTAVSSWAIDHAPRDWHIILLGYKIPDEHPYTDHDIYEDATNTSNRRDSNRRDSNRNPSHSNSSSMVTSTTKLSSTMVTSTTTGRSKNLQPHNDHNNNSSEANPTHSTVHPINPINTANVTQQPQKQQQQQQQLPLHRSLFFGLHAYLINKRGIRRILFESPALPLAMQLDIFVGRLAQSGTINVCALPTSIAVQLGWKYGSRIQLDRDKQLHHKTPNFDRIPFGDDDDNGTSSSSSVEALEHLRTLTAGRTFVVQPHVLPRSSSTVVRLATIRK
jgi:GR25 family glycosyltransferase involved in LPS biosynthesis